MGQAAVAPEVSPADHPTPARAWIALLLVLGPVWWIAVPWSVNRFLFELPDVGILLGPLLSFLTALVGLVLALQVTTSAAQRGWSTVVARVSVALFIAFTALFAVLFLLLVLAWRNGGL